MTPPPPKPPAKPKAAKAVDSAKSASTAPAGPVAACPAPKAAPTASAPPPSPPAGVLTKDQADALFKDLAAKKEDIPFDYPRDCCYARAHEMCRIMKEKNIPSGKVWNYAHNYPSDGLSVKTTNVPEGQVSWRYHVASTVQVQGKDGKVQTMVMDPSTFDHPVTEKEWKDHQNDPKSTLVESKPDVFFRDKDGTVEKDDDYSGTKESLSNHKVSRALEKGSK